MPVDSCCYPDQSPQVQDYVVVFPCVTLVYYQDVQFEWIWEYQQNKLTKELSRHCYHPDESEVAPLRKVSTRAVSISTHYPTRSAPNDIEGLNVPGGCINKLSNEG